MAKTETKTQASPKTNRTPKTPTNARGAGRTKNARPAKGPAKPKTPLDPAPATTIAMSRTSAASASSPRQTTKLQIVIDLLDRPRGARINELMAATGWQAHSVRGAIAGSLKKRGLVVTSEKVDGCRRYSTVKADRA